MCIRYVNMVRLHMHHHLMWLNVFWWGTLRVWKMNRFALIMFDLNPIMPPSAPVANLCMCQHRSALHFRPLWAVIHKNTRKQFRSASEQTFWSGGHQVWNNDNVFQVACLTTQNVHFGETHFARTEKLRIPLFKESNLYNRLQGAKSSEIYKTTDHSYKMVIGESIDRLLPLFTPATCRPNSIVCHNKTIEVRQQLHNSSRYRKTRIRRQ